MYLSKADKKNLDIEIINYILSIIDKKIIPNLRKLQFTKQSIEKMILCNLT